MHESIWKKLYASLEFGIVTTVSFLLGVYITQLFGAGMPMIGGLWVAISAIIVLQETKDIAMHFALVRISGSFLGAVISCILLAFLPVNFYSIFFIIFITAFTCKIINFEEGLRLAALTAAIIIAVSFVDPGVKYYLNSTARFIESCCGSFLAIAVRYATHYGSKYLKN